MRPAVSARIICVPAAGFHTVLTLHRRNSGKTRANLIRRAWVARGDIPTNRLAKYGPGAMAIEPLSPSEDDWFEYRLEHHPEFLRRIADARTPLREGRGIPFEAL